MSLKSVRCLALVILAALPLLPCACFAAAGKEATVPELMSTIKNNPDPAARLAAIAKLSNISEADERNNNVVDALTKLTATTQDPLVGKAAVRTLQELQKNGSKKAKVTYIPVFITLLKDLKTLPSIRSAIAENFFWTLDKNDLPDRQAYTVLTDIAKNRAEPNLALRGKSIEAMGAFGDPDSVSTLADLLSDPDPYIKEAASKAMGILFDKFPDAVTGVKLAAANKLVDMLKDNTLSIDLKAVIIHVVAQLIAANTPGANKGLEEIVRLVNVSAEDKIITAGIDGLGIIGSPESTDPLIKAYDDFSKNAANELNLMHRREVVLALGQILRIQANRANPDLPTVHKIAALLIHVLDTDPVAGLKEAAIYSIVYLYPPKFSAEHKEAANALVFLMEAVDKNLDSAKTLIPDTLEAITGVNFGKDVNRWKEWLLKKWPAPKNGK